MVPPSSSLVRPLARAGIGCSIVAAGAACALTFSPACDEAVHPPSTIDCSQADSYDIIETYSLTTTPTWYQYGDTTPGAVETPGTVLVDGGYPIPWTEAIENGGLCGSQVALVLQSEGFHDYGSGFGDYDPGSLLTACLFPDGATGANCSYDASAYQGIAFWARSPGNHTKSVTVELADGNSYDSPSALTQCLYQTNFIDSGGLAGQPTMVVVSPTGVSGTGTTTTGGSGQQLPPGTCGNNFVYPLVTSDDWQLYKIPFSAFYQTATPNKEPKGFDPSTFFWLGMIVPKEAQLELWIDGLGFYPKKQAGGG